MQKSAGSFATLQHLLEGLGFVRKKVDCPQLVFEHTPSDTWFLFRAYKPRDKVTAADLIGVRKILDGRGVLDEDDFDELLQQSSA
jgi:hypothetical protein